MLQPLAQRHIFGIVFSSNPVSIGRVSPIAQERSNASADSMCTAWKGKRVATGQSLLRPSTMDSQGARWLEASKIRRQCSYATVCAVIHLDYPAHMRQGMKCPAVGQSQLLGSFSWTVMLEGHNDELGILPCCGCNLSTIARKAADDEVNLA